MLLLVLALAWFAPALLTSTGQVSSQATEDYRPWWTFTGEIPNNPVSIWSSSS